MKLKEEEQRAVRYLETRKGCDSVKVVRMIKPNLLLSRYEQLHVVQYGENGQWSVTFLHVFIDLNFEMLCWVNIETKGK